MATNLIKITEQTPLVWADTTDYSSTVSGLARTAQIDLTSVSSAAARQGAQADLGATRWPQYVVSVAMEFASGTVSGETVDIYWAGSPSGTAANANPGGTSGSDAAYTGTAGDSLADSVKQLTFIGSLVTTSDNTTVVQYGNVGVLFGDSMLRYGMPVVVNNSTGALVGDAVEMYVALTPTGSDIQASA
jgi:hypothetical protein